MNFENKGNWIKEAQDKLAARDTMEDPDYLEGDHKVITFEDEELDNVPSDKEFEDEYLDEDLLSEDPLDEVSNDKQINEVRYIDPANLDRYDASEIEEVTTASGEKRYKRRSTGTNVNTSKVEPAQKDFESFANDYANNEAKEIASLQLEINRYATAERRRGRPGYYRYDIEELRDKQKQLLPPLAKQLVNMSTSDAADAVKDILSKTEMPERNKNNFGYMLAKVQIDDSGKTLADSLGLSASRFSDMIGKFQN